MIELMLLPPPEHDCRHCSSVLIDLPCRCQNVHYSCGRIDYEHDHVICDGKVKVEPEGGW